MEGERDPILDESKFCSDCESEVLQLIQYVRNLENAQIVAKEALDTLSWANEKLTEKVEDLRERVNQSERLNIKTKMQELSDAEQRMVNREKLVA